MLNRHEMDRLVASQSQSQAGSAKTSVSNEEEQSFEERKAAYAAEEAKQTAKMEREHEEQEKEIRRELDSALVSLRKVARLSRIAYYVSYDEDEQLHDAVELLDTMADAHKKIFEEHPKWSRW